MLPKSQRLNLKFDFVRVVKGRHDQTEHLKLFWVFDEQPSPLVGISVPRKLFKKAHQRNRARRLISAAVQQQYPSLPKELSLVIMPKIGLLECSSEQLEQELHDSQLMRSSH
jgi:ribonuclease P protein component